MIYNIKITGLSIMILVLILSGCTGGGRSDATDDFYENFRQGTESLDIEFHDNIVREVFENQDPITIPVDINNEGAFPQTDEIMDFIARVWVGGFDRNIIELIPEPQILSSEELLGRGPTLPRGGETVVLLRGRTWELPQGKPTIEQDIQVALTFTYRTLASAEVCIDPDPRSTTIREESCDVDDYRTLGIGAGQGAPVSVDRVEETATRGQTLFKIYISNDDNGIIIHRDDIDKNPFSGYDISRTSKVRLTDINVGGIKLTECRPGIGEYVDLFDDEGYIFCKYDTNGITSTFKSHLNIQLDYGYSVSDTHDIKIYKDVVY
jgi:hypothetical protein